MSYESCDPLIQINIGVANLELHVPSGRAGYNSSTASLVLQSPLVYVDAQLSLGVPDDA